MSDQHDISAHDTNMKHPSVTTLRALVRWFDNYERDWSAEYRHSPEFFDLQIVIDQARKVIT